MGETPGFKPHKETKARSGCRDYSTFAPASQPKGQHQLLAQPLKPQSLSTCLSPLLSPIWSPPQPWCPSIAAPLYLWSTPMFSSNVNHYLATCPLSCSSDFSRSKSIPDSTGAVGGFIGFVVQRSFAPSFLSAFPGWDLKVEPIWSISIVCLCYSLDRKSHSSHPCIPCPQMSKHACTHTHTYFK